MLWNTFAAHFSMRFVAHPVAFSVVHCPAELNSLNAPPNQTCDSWFSRNGQKLPRYAGLRLFRSLLIAHRPMLSSVALTPRLSHAHVIITLNLQVDADLWFKGNVSDWSICPRGVIQWGTTLSIFHSVSNSSCWLLFDSSPFLQSSTQKH
jgi:hypothetical protein